VWLFNDMRNQIIIFVEGNLVVLFSNNVECAEDIKGVIDSSLDVFEVHFLNVISLELLMKLASTFREFHEQSKEI